MATARLAGARRRFGPTIPRRLRKPGWLLGGGIVLVAALLALLAPLVALHSPTELYYDAIQSSPSAQFFFGTDELGRSVFSRVVYGTRISLLVGLSAVAIGVGVGAPLGLLAGFYGRTVDATIMRCLEILLAFPSILLAIAIVAILGPQLTNTVIAVGIASVPVFALTVRSSTLTAMEMDYVQSARALGASSARIMFRHVVPNVLSPIIVVATVNIGSAILTAAGLGYVGLGAQPPTPELGSMLSEARAYLQDAWWMSVFPGVTITVLIVGFNLLGDALRDFLDPRQGDR